jgi:hypothetical protein
VPEEQYAYKADSNTEASEDAIVIANKETDLNEAIAALKPPKLFNTNVHNMRKTMHGLTMAFERTKQSIAVVDGNKDFIFKSVNIKPAYNKPAEASRYPTLDPIFDMCNSEFDAFTEHYRKGASRILATAQRKKLFLLRLERVNVLVHTHLSKTLGPKHVDSFREFNNLVISDTSNNEHDLAVLGVRRVLNKLDLEMLAYLDINRASLIADFEKTHTLKDYETLPQSEKDTVDHVTTTILGYLKLATCKNHSQLSTEQIEQQAEAKLLAKYQAKAAFKATLATDEAVAATELPQDLTALGNFVQEVVDKDKAKATNQLLLRNALLRTKTRTTGPTPTKKSKS